MLIQIIMISIYYKTSEVIINIYRYYNQIGSPIIFINYLLMKQQGSEIVGSQINNQPKQQQAQLSPQQKKKVYKKRVITVLIVILALICFIFSIVAISAAVTYFSFMFSLTTELIAKAYLQLYYSWFMAITYLAIFGCVIVVANTAVFFTQFSQKQRIIWIHLIFYLAMFVTGIVALVGNADYQKTMMQKITCSQSSDIQCQLSLRYLIFRSQVTSYFIGYCIVFFIYAGLYHYASYTQKRERQEKNLSHFHLNNNTQNDANQAAKNTNISFEQN